MSFSTNRVALALVAALTAATAACGGNSAVPPSAPSGAGSASSVLRNAAAAPADNTSVLKKLTKDVVIGSTVDPTNGDTGPHGVSIVQANYILKKGQLVVCNFANSHGTAGEGTTIDLFDPQPSSSPKTLVRTGKINGCTGVATTAGNDVYAAGMTAKEDCGFTNTGKLIKCYIAPKSPFKAPFSIADAHCKQGPTCLYNAEYIFTSDASTGGIVSYSINNYGNKKSTQVASGFAVNGASGWGALGPSGISYDEKKNVLYIADGVDNTVVGFTNASELLVKNEIVVQPGGKTFKCAYPKTTCGELVLSGSPLNAPEAMTILPNGNLIAANTAGGNTLVEFTPAGKVLDTKVVDTGNSPAIFGLAASGTKDSNTVLFYTDTNSNTLHELEP